MWSLEQHDFELEKLLELKILCATLGLVNWKLWDGAQQSENWSQKNNQI
jgi:hypothetical protein